MKARWVLRLIEVVHRIRPALTPRLHAWYLRLCKKGILENRAEETFAHIYRINAWKGDESVSGPGSSLHATQAIRQALPGLIATYNITSVLDIPCGDFHWMQTIDWGHVRYIGADIVPALIQSNKKYERPGYRFEVLDLRHDDLPTVDLVLVRDALVHFSLTDALRALRNIGRSKARYLLATTMPGVRKNTEIITGEWRPLNLLREPFSLPKPLLYLHDDSHPPHNAGKRLALWRVQDLDLVNDVSALSQNPKSSLVRIAIFGAYKTGTTALFYKIYNSLPVKPRTLFEELLYHPQRRDLEMPVLAKVILNGSDELKNDGYDSFMSFDKKILLVRDPRDWVISGLLFITQRLPGFIQDPDLADHFLALLSRKESDPESITVCDLLSHIASASAVKTLKELKKWMQTHYAWLLQFEKQLDDHIIVRYEDFVDRKVSALETYLEFPLTGSDWLPPHHAHVKRTGGYGNWRHWFRPEDVAFFKPIFAAYMDHYGYQDDWTLHPTPTINPAHASEYVANLIQKRRGLPS